MVPVYVLIGGKSSRFGEDKASYELRGQPWAAVVGQRLSNDGEFVLVGGPPVRGMLSGRRQIADVESNSGPLAGLLAAIRDRKDQAGAGLLVVTACDLVAPEAAWLAPLMRAHEENPDLDAACYKSETRWQPFPLLAHTRWRSGLAERLAAKDRSLQAALDRSRVAACRWEGEDSGPPQANTKAELRGHNC